MINNNILKIIFVIIGIMVGAGFASGKEIFIFFNVYGIKGYMGLLISMIIMGAVINKTLKISYSNNINSYEGMNDYLIKDKKVLKYTIINIVNIFLLISFYIMIAGFGAYFAQEFKIPSIYGMITISVLSYIIFFNNVDGLLKVNEILVPILVIAIIAVGMKTLDIESIVNINSETGKSNWLISSIFYASYNSIILIPILINLKEYVANSKEINKISILVTIIMVIIASIIYFILNSKFHNVKNIEIPVLYAINELGNGYKNIYGIAILSAIFTSSVAAGYGFLSNISKTKKVYNILNFAICISALIISNIGFSNLMNLLYPIFGALGLIQIFCLFIKKT